MTTTTDPILQAIAEAATKRDVLVIQATARGYNAIQHGDALAARLAELTTDEERTERLAAMEKDARGPINESWKRRPRIDLNTGLWVGGPRHGQEAS